MEYRPITCPSVITPITKKDPLFLGTYTFDPYQNCEFSCRYCDSSTDKTIYIKSNAVETFEKEIGRIGKGVIIVGSVHDPYQKAEEKYKITRNLLKTIKKYDFSCHILTKSDMILRDINILSEMVECMVTISITTLDESITSIFEKNVPSPRTRLLTVKKLSNQGIKAGIAVIPMLPFIVEKNELENIVRSAYENHAQYLLHKHLELKGDQKNVFMETLKISYPDLIDKYEKLYQDSYMPQSDYISELNKNLYELCNKYNLKNKI